jgi:hypothetical protein
MFIELPVIICRATAAAGWANISRGASNFVICIFFYYKINATSLQYLLAETA